jgi:hypothetical protein
VTSSRLERWLRAEARRERSRASLEDVVVFGRFDRYVWQRSRRFAVTRLVQELLHAGELYLMFLFASQDAFVAAAAVAFVMRAGGSAWWGALELLRSGVRERCRDGRYLAAGPFIHQWVRGVAGGAASLAAGVVTIAAVKLATGDFGVADLYATTSLVGFAIELPIRTFHAGAYAVRRIYQPTWALVAPSLMRGAVLAAAWPAVGVWAIPCAGFCAVSASASLSWYFTRRTYRDIGLWPLPPPRRETGRWFEWRPASAAALAGASIAVGHVSGALMLLPIGAADPNLWLGLFLYVVLAAPLLDACVGWTRLFYPDLAVLETELLSWFRQVLQHRLVRWSVVAGAMAWLATVPLLLILPGDRIGVLAVLTLALFVARARFAAVQLIAFSNRRYAVVTLMSLLFAAVVIAEYAAGSAGRSAWIASATLIVLAMTPPAAPRRPPSGLVPLASAIGAAPGIAGDGIWAIAEFRPGSLLHGPEWLLQRSARHAGAIGMDRERWLLRWHARADVSRRVLDPLRDLQRRQWSSPCGSAVDGIRALAAHWPAGTLPDARPIDRIVEEFQQRFPGGTCIIPGRPPDGPPADLAWRERQAVLDEAVRHAFGRSPGALLPVDVSALVHDGRMAAIFLVPRDSPQSVRRRWRRWLRDVAVANALAAVRNGVGDAAASGQTAPTRDPVPVRTAPPSAARSMVSRAGNAFGIGRTGTSVFADARSRAERHVQSSRRSPGPRSLL